MKAKHSTTTFFNVSFFFSPMQDLVRAAVAPELLQLLSALQLRRLGTCAAQLGLDIFDWFSSLRYAKGQCGCDAGGNSLALVNMPLFFVSAVHNCLPCCLQWRVATHF